MSHSYLTVCHIQLRKFGAKEKIVEKVDPSLCWITVSSFKDFVRQGKKPKNGWKHGYLISDSAAHLAGQTNEVLLLKVS